MVSEVIFMELSEQRLRNTWHNCFAMPLYFLLSQHQQQVQFFFVFTFFARISWGKMVATIVVLVGYQYLNYGESC